MFIPRKHEQIDRRVYCITFYVCPLTQEYNGVRQFKFYVFKYVQPKESMT